MTTPKHWVSVDVNSAHQGRDIEETATCTNHDGALRQMRLAPTQAAWIVIDFIDMEESRPRCGKLRDAAARTAPACTRATISKFGPMEMSRRAVRPAAKAHPFQPALCGSASHPH
jgi:Ribonuclease G/E